MRNNVRIRQKDFFPWLMITLTIRGRADDVDIHYGHVVVWGHIRHVHVIDGDAWTSHQQLWKTVDERQQRHTKHWFLQWQSTRCMKATFVNKGTNICHLALLLVHFFFYILFQNLVLINWQKGPWYQRVPALRVFLNKGNTEGTNSLKKLYLTFVYVSLYVNLCQDWFCVFSGICGLMTCVQSK